MLYLIEYFNGLIRWIFVDMIVCLWRFVKVYVMEGVEDIIDGDVVIDM